MKQCLLIRTKDKRRFLTAEKNLKPLVEFIKTFAAEVHLVEVIQGAVIPDLKTLVDLICNPDYSPKVKVNKIEKVYPRPRKNRELILKNAKRIKKFIEDSLLAGEAVSLSSLKGRYKGCGYTDACLCNHLSSVRKRLNRKGYAISKIAPGTYKLDAE